MLADNSLTLLDVNSFYELFFLLVLFLQVPHSSCFLPSCLLDVHIYISFFLVLKSNSSQKLLLSYIPHHVDLVFADPSVPPLPSGPSYFVCIGGVCFVPLILLIVQGDSGGFSFLLNPLPPSSCYCGQQSSHLLSPAAPFISSFVHLLGPWLPDWGDRGT